MGNTQNLDSQGAFRVQSPSQHPSTPKSNSKKELDFPKDDQVRFVKMECQYFPITFSSDGQIQSRLQPFRTKSTKSVRIRKRKFTPIFRTSERIFVKIGNLILWILNP